MPRRPCSRSWELICRDFQFPAASIFLPVFDIMQDFSAQSENNLRKNVTSSDLLLLWLFSTWSWSIDVYDVPNIEPQELNYVTDGRIFESRDFDSTHLMIGWYLINRQNLSLSPFCGGFFLEASCSCLLPNLPCLSSDSVMESYFTR